MALKLYAYKKLQIFQYYPFSFAPVCKFKAYIGNCYKTYRKGLCSWLYGMVKRNRIVSRKKSPKYKMQTSPNNEFSHQVSGEVGIIFTTWKNILTSISGKESFEETCPLSQSHAILF